MIKRTTAVLLAAVAIGGVAACGEDDEDEATGAAAETSAAMEAEEASVEFVSPTEGEATGDEVTAEVELEGFELAADQVGMDASAGQGHLHFALDGGEYDYPKYSGENGKLAEQLGVDGKYSPSTEPTITYSGLPKGEHTLEVFLAENDHTDAGVVAETTFTVE